MVSGAMDEHYVINFILIQSYLIQSQAIECLLAQSAWTVEYTDCISAEG